MSGVTCDTRVTGRLEGKMYTTVVSSDAVWFGHSSTEQERAGKAGGSFFLGVTRMDRVRREFTRGT